ncbi:MULTISPECIES: GNAT family N-acetyltransferase [Olivibacter]|uniref:GNAT family N-acetyltransferase n=1 Tax=Olivibacter oleidegradans TaxID=760123 RepID=A0ABV6HQG4_9SPHI|nr:MULTISPECIES: GNAT family N-acetyltransferase [Olivibacter]QEL03895.1 N-acetyltransferase [Olivibacter sp. LS-1]
MELRTMNDTDWPAVRTIYLQGIATGQATFQTEAPSWEDWDGSHLKHSRFIASIDGHIAGWAALSPVSSRCVYAGVAEVSVYIHEDYRGKGVGSFLMNALVESSEKQGLWTLQSGIFPENEASIRLHEKHGFRQLGYREKVGKHGNTWRDTTLMERRSKTIGID